MPSTLTPLAIDPEQIAVRAKFYEPDMVRFLRDLVAIPAESSQEGPVIQRIRQEMLKVGFEIGRAHV